MGARRIDEPVKRYGRLWERVCSRENIEAAADNAVKGRRARREQMRFLADREALLDDVERMLRTETYRFGPLKSFTVREPKERVIHHPAFYPDKILHHCLMNVLAPLIISKLSPDSYGSIKGRGLSQAVEAIKRYAREYADGYYLQIDIRHFYQSIDHEVCLRELEHMVKCRKTLRLARAIVEAHPEGMAIGVYPSQYLANLTLCRFDHWVKEVLHVPRYVRYMDDMLFFVPTKQEAHGLLEAVSARLDGLGLAVKPNARIAPVAVGIDMVGYVFYPTHTRLRRRIKEHMQQSIRRLTRRNVDDATFKRRLASHFGWCLRGDCRHLVRTSMGEKYHIFKDNMEFKRLSELRPRWFDLPKEARVSIQELYGKDVVLFDYLIDTIKNEEKAVIKFAYPDRPEEMHYTITRSEVVRDRLARDKGLMPFVCQFNTKKKYICYE